MSKVDGAAWHDLPIPDVIETFDDFTATVDGTRVPEELKDRKLWVLWDFREKTPFAPWKNGHCYPTEWNRHLDPDERPEITYDEVKPWIDMTPEELDVKASFPRTTMDDEPINQPVPNRIGPTILLPPYPNRRLRLMYIDLDDVRDPETRELVPEAAMIIERLGSATYVSLSGTGVHIIVWATLPDHCDAVTGEPLKSTGSIEIYDQRRFFAGTWEHVAGTPTEIHERQDVIDALVDCYYPPEKAGAASTSVSNPQGKNRESAPRRPKARGGDRSPYYNVKLEHFAGPDPIEINGSDGPQGAHSHHGKTTKGETDKSTNYNFHTIDNKWYCFAHQSGGGPLEMAAVMAEVKHCRWFHGGGVSSLTDIELLKTCLYARDKLHGFSKDMDPPYSAVRGAAESAGPASSISYALAGFVALLAALSLSELATAMPVAGDNA
jgi:hypothetical protein